MARTHFVKKARRDHGSCQSPRCTHDDRAIKAGEPYKWFKRKSSYGGTVFTYHENCHIPQSHRTTSRMGEIYDAQDDIEIPGEPGETSDLESIGSEFAQVVQSVSEEYAGSADSMEEGFGHATYQSDELRERAEALESWASDLESIDFDEFDEDSALEEARSKWDSENPDNEGDATGIDSLVDEARDDWWNEQVEKLQDEISNNPV